MGWLARQLRSEDRRRAEWCKAHARSRKVRAWLARNPPPKEWRGSPMEWAYTEMPFGPR